MSLAPHVAQAAEPPAIRAGTGGAAANLAEGSAAAALALRVSSNRRYLEDSLGRPFLLNHEAAWSLGRYASDADVATYFADRAARNFNGAIIELMEREDASNPSGVNFNGDTPFTAVIDGQPDFSTPREAFWRRVDYILSTAKANRIVVLAFPIYVGAVNGRDGWYQAMLANGTARMQSYSKFLASRYGSDGLVWVVGGDLSPASTPVPMSATGVELLNAFATSLRAALPAAIVTSHWAGEDRGSSTKWGNGDMHGLNGVYRDSIVADEALRDYALPGPIPIVGLEHLYAGAKSTTDVAIRAQSYQLMCSGGAGVSYGNGHIWNFDGPASAGPPWKSHLNDASTLDAQRLYQLFSRLAWHRLVPGNCVRAGGGTLGSSDYVAAAATTQGDLMVAYVPDSHLGAVTLDLSRMSGPSRARWWDPRAGTFVNAASERLLSSGTRAFTVPGVNAAGDRDWLLVLDTAPSAQAAPAMPRWGMAVLTALLLAWGLRRTSTGLSRGSAGRFDDVPRARDIALTASC